MLSTRISFNPDSIARKFGLITAILIFVSTSIKLTDFLTGQNSVLLHKLNKLFYVDLELNVPAFFSMLLLLFASVLLAAIAILAKKHGDFHVRDWAIVSFGFLIMAFDEIIAVHERLIEPMRTMLGEENLGALHFAWVVPAIAFVLFSGLYFLKFLRNLPSRTRFRFLLAGAVYVGAAIGFELIEGRHAEIYGKDNLVYILLTTIEESLEMLGIIIFIRALLLYIAENFGELKLQFNEFINNS